MLSPFRHGRLFATPWTVAQQAPLSMGFCRQEYWSGLSMPSSRGSSWPRDQTHLFCTGSGFFTAKPPGKWWTQFKFSPKVSCWLSHMSLTSVLHSQLESRLIRIHTELFEIPFFPSPVLGPEVWNGTQWAHQGMQCNKGPWAGVNFRELVWTSVTWCEPLWAQLVWTSMSWCELLWASVNLHDLVWTSVNCCWHWPCDLCGSNNRGAIGSDWSLSSGQGWPWAAQGSSGEKVHFLWPDAPGPPLVGATATCGSGGSWKRPVPLKFLSEERLASRHQGEMQHPHPDEVGGSRTFAAPPKL